MIKGRGSLPEPISEPVGETSDAIHCTTNFNGFPIDDRGHYGSGMSKL
jgi:hypothetical protein